MIATAGVSALVFAIRKSSGFATFMTPAHVAPLALVPVIESELVAIQVKDALADRFGEFTVGATRHALAALASYTLERGKRLAVTDLARLASERLATAIILPLLNPLLSSLTLTEIATLLTALGGDYVQLTSADGRRPRITNTPAERALVNRLQALGVVSSIKEDAGVLKINMRKG